MPIYRLPLIFVAFLLTACGIPNHTHEKLDIGQFNATQVNGVAHQTRKHEILAEQSRMPDGGYLEKLSAPTYKHPCFGAHKEYYETGELKFVAPICYGFYYSKGKEYDKIGNAIKTINFDEPYKFSVWKLYNKIRREFGIDIFHEDVQLSRTSETGPPVYKLALPVTGDLNIKRYLIVDANTGVFVSNTIGPAQKLNSKNTLDHVK